MIKKIYQIYLSCLRKRNNSLISVRIKNNFKKAEEINFIQIGSNDGKSGNDPIRNFILNDCRWKGIVVEPLEKYFNDLKNNYLSCGARVSFIKKAVAEKNSFMDFYTISEKAKQNLNLPDWYSQISSFDINHLYKHFGTEIEPYILKEKIETVSLSKLLEDVGNNVDLIHVDAEGYDWKILSQLNFSICLPKIIIFEYRHLSSVEIKHAKQILRKKYKIYDCGCDFMCVKKMLSN